jgi:hypothetical protein
LTDVAALARHKLHSQEMRTIGLKAMNETATIVEIEARTRTCRPLASAEWIVDAVRAINRKLGPAKRGPKPSGSHYDAN